MSEAAAEALKTIRSLPREERILIFAELRQEFDETAYLLSTEANQKAIFNSLAQAKAGMTVPHALIEE
ncbi:MAG: hypothetical protein AAGC74_08290 [Verrucomicrobiota bacterium]